ncbi:2Fe-2S iron-sulfur cluster-binding protein [Arthrobacter crystallopoietes]|uniref:2Fe-2S iron-sulfur cluster-binding protein n=1 Tax=Crystallibacter crystallopoietes TaxID=37928 RepID=UPI003D25B797
MSDTTTITKLNVTDRDGTQRKIDWEPQQSLMEALRDNDFPILASCGGTASCATCHVFLPKEVCDSLGERSEDELELLEEVSCYDAGTSRLACQVSQDESLDGISVTIAPEED